MTSFHVSLETSPTAEASLQHQDEDLNTLYQKNPQMILNVPDIFNIEIRHNSLSEHLWKILDQQYKLNYI
jgi:hypothetical protein